MTKQKAQQVCATWWARQIIHGGANWNNGDDSPTGGVVAVMAMLLQGQARQRIDDKAEAIFIAELVNQLETNIYARHHVSTDYHPDQALFAALAKAGIPPESCPCKTVTWINEKDGDFTVVASLGYHGEHREITAEMVGIE